MPADPQLANLLWSQLRKTLDAVQPFALERGVKIAIENLIDFQAVEFDKLPVEQASDNRELIADLFAAYPPEFLGLCYDPGHGNLGYDRMEVLDMFKDRLSVLHLNGNQGLEDEHLNVFMGTLDWDRLAQLIAASSYTKPMSLEVCLKPSYPSQEVFLQEAWQAGTRFAELVASYRG
jgi:sugar phosphate isomerase/epimerase